ncbi:alpha/beta hydrolase fold domain-containing protein [Streptomyces sp. NPDC001980]|uniref:alpha/beta hydrolase fold domain-containing protein n=1 Tax=Streptomyces sp. NPDC001980 TaxID=3157126 RepID=UPI00331D216B
MTINRTAMIDFVDSRIAQTSDPKHVRQLKVLRAHMLAEVDEDVDALLATISPTRQDADAHLLAVRRERPARRRGDLFLGIARDAVTVGGVSAGGSLAAVVALMARDLDGPAIALQLLEAAGTDLTKTSSAWRHPRSEHDTTREADLAMIDLCLSSLAERAHPSASPLFAPSLDGVAPAYLINAEFDPRRDECEACAARLPDAGVQAVGRTLPGHVHGSFGLPDWQPARDWRAAANAVLASANAAARAGRPVPLTAL